MNQIVADPPAAVDPPAVVADPAPAAVDPPAAPPSLISGAEPPKAAEGAEPPKDEPPKADPAPAFEPITAEALKLPEGVNPEALEAFLGVLNTPDLSRADMAQKFIDLQNDFNEKANAAATEAAQGLWDQTQADWISQCRALPEIGGDKLDTTLADIKRGLNSAGADEAVYTALSLTGAGSHPAIVKLMHTLVQPFLEQKPIGGQPTKGTLSAAEKMYPTMQKKE